MSSISSITTKQLHHETSAVLDEVERGKSFEVTRQGKVVCRIEPAGKRDRARWDDIMQPVWDAQKQCKSKVPNPVIEERQRRRR
jgi:antitoxin (DNA-binding transcriptional repressor) of toxin-antitoxin stability system